MAALAHVTRVEVVGHHRLNLEFEDGSRGEVDMSGDDWRGVFAPLKDPEFFARVELDEQLGTVVWPNGADIAPETLYAWAVEGVERSPA